MILFQNNNQFIHAKKYLEDKKISIDTYFEPSAPVGTISSMIFSIKNKLLQKIAKKYLLFFARDAIIYESLVNSSETETRRGSVW